MASARQNDSHVTNYYQLLGLSENASSDEIYRAFRVRALEVHPDKNPEDKVRATKEFQLLTKAKIVLLDPERRREFDESLVDNGVRNCNALPLLCSICTNAESRVGSRCLNGMGHINPLIEAFNAASKEYKGRMRTKSKKSSGANEFLLTLQEVLQKFLFTDLHRLYPLAAKRKQGPCSKEVPTDLGTQFPASGISSQTSTVPSAADVVKILNLSLVRKSKGTAPVQQSSANIPVYDLSSLSSSELEQIFQYFGLPSTKPFSHTSETEKLSVFIPKCAVKTGQSCAYEDRSRHVCQQCGKKIFFSLSFLLSFDTCFSCRDVCCWECLSKRKVPSSGSYDLRSLCATCQNAFTVKEATIWLIHGQYLLKADKKYLEAALAMYNLSNELYPSDVAVMHQAQALFCCEEHERLVRYGKDVLCKTTFDLKNTQRLQKLVAESLMKIAQDADDSDLLRKADKYEEAIKWTEQFAGESGNMVRELKVEAMRRRLHCLQSHEKAKKQRVKMLVSHLIADIREGSLLKMFTVLRGMSDEDKDACLRQLSTESLDTYSPFGKLLLRLAKTTIAFKQDPIGASGQIADIFWSGYSLFLENHSREHIFNFVIHFTCQLLKGSHGLPLEKLLKITPTNFLQCLDLTENDIFSPPDIEDRWWQNVSVEGCNMKMFLKYELAVKKLSETKNWSPVKVALSYYDLVPACNHPSQLLVTLITSAQWFARQISMSNSDDTLQYSCKKMILELTNLAAALSFEFGIHPHLQLYVARMVLGLQFYASSKAPCGSQDDAKTIGEHLNWLVAAGRLCPSHKMPIVSPAESVILRIISRDLYCEYLLKLQNELPPQLRPVSEAILCYHIYENHWLKRCQLDDPTGNGLRLTAMTELLLAEDWSWNGVQLLLQWNMVPLDTQGWLVSNHQLLEPVASSGIRQVVGLEINKKDFSIQLLIREQTRKAPSLLCWEDIGIGLTIDPGCFFSLEAVSPQETLYHPFNKQIFLPKELRASRFLNTLFHTDYLLKQLSTGFEISSYPPFLMRPIHEGLLKGLPNELQKVLLSVPSRGRSRSRVHRFWIQADAMEYDVQENDDTLRWLFGNVNMSIRCKPMIHSQDGRLEDQDVLSPEPDSPEGRFIADFTKHYDQIGKYFPEFLRLKELCKVQFLGAFVASLEENLEEHSRLLESEEMDSKYTEIYVSAVQECQNEARKKLDRMLGEKELTVGFINNEMIQQIYQEAKIPASYDEIYNWVRSGDSRVIANNIALKSVPSVSQIKQQSINAHARKLKQYRSSVSSLKQNFEKCLPSTELANGCCWVPAVCHCDDGQIIYGGVALLPKTRKVTVRLRRGFSIVPLTGNCSRFQKAVNRPPVKQFNPPRTIGRKLLSTNGVGAGTDPTGGDSGGTSSSSDSEDCESLGNLTRKRASTVRSGRPSRASQQPSSKTSTVRSGRPSRASQQPSSQTSTVGSGRPSTTSQQPSRQTSTVRSGRPSTTSQQPSSQTSTVGSGRPSTASQQPSKKTSTVGSGRPSTASQQPSKKTSTVRSGRPSTASQQPSRQTSTVRSGRPSTASQQPSRQTSTASSGRPSTASQQPPRQTSTVGTGQPSTASQKPSRQSRDCGGDWRKKKLEKEVERMMKIWGLNEEKHRIRKDKVCPASKQYKLPCRPGLTAWDTVLIEFRERIPPGEEWTPVSDQEYKTTKEALDSIKKGESMDNKKIVFLGDMVSPDDLFKWRVIARHSSLDKRPTIELQLIEIEGIEFDRNPFWLHLFSDYLPIKIRYGDNRKV